MRLLKKSVWAKIDGKGNLDFYRGELDAFLKLHPGRNVVIRFEVMPKEPSKKTLGYYYGYVLPTINRAFYNLGYRYTEEKCDLLLRTECPAIGELKKEDGRWVKKVKPFENLDSAEANEYIEWLKEYSAENLNCIIDDP